MTHFAQTNCGADARACVHFFPHLVVFVHALLSFRRRSSCLYASADLSARLKVISSAYDEICVTATDYVFMEHFFMTHFWLSYES